MKQKYVVLFIVVFLQNCRLIDSFKKPSSVFGKGSKKEQLEVNSSIFTSAKKLPQIELKSIDNVEITLDGPLGKNVLNPTIEKPSSMEFVKLDTLGSYCGVSCLESRNQKYLFQISPLDRIKFSEMATNIEADSVRIEFDVTMYLESDYDIRNYKINRSHISTISYDGNNLTKNENLFSSINISEAWVAGEYKNIHLSIYLKNINSINTMKNYMAFVFNNDQYTFELNEKQYTNLDLENAVSTNLLDINFTTKEKNGVLTQTRVKSPEYTVEGLGLKNIFNKEQKIISYDDYKKYSSSINDDDSIILLYNTDKSIYLEETNKNALSSPVKLTKKVNDVSRINNLFIQLDKESYVVNDQNIETVKKNMGCSNIEKLILSETEKGSNPPCNPIICKYDNYTVQSKRVSKDEFIKILLAKGYVSTGSVLYKYFPANETFANVLKELNNQKYYIGTKNNTCENSSAQEFQQNIFDPNELKFSTNGVLYE